MTGPGESVLAEARARFRWADYRYRLVSLLGIMKNFDAALFFDYSAGLMRYAGHPSFWDALAAIDPAEYVPDVLSRPEMKESSIEYLAGIVRACREVGLNSSVRAAERLISTYEVEIFNKEDLESQYRELRRIMQGELEDHAFLRVEPAHRMFYENPLEEWRDAVGRFPSAQRDLEEASKCLALDRPTACVFHLMRAMGPALTAIAEVLEIRKHFPTWSAFLIAFRSAYTVRFSGKTAADADALAFYSGVEAHLTSVKDAWRNPTMHAVEISYSESEALDIYRSVGAFLRKIAMRLSEMETK